MVTHENKHSDGIPVLSTRSFRLFSLLLLCSTLVFLTSCSSDATDFATLAPSDSLVFIESKDIGSALGAIGGSVELRNVVEEAPDFSSLDGIKFGLFVTGLDVNENPVSESGSELRLRPKFIAVAEGTSWFWSPESFLEGPLRGFVTKSYGKNIKAEEFDEKDGRVTAWKSSDGRSAYAAVRENLVFFSNDRESILSVLATRRGERDNISGNSALQRMRAADGIASGYVSQAGVLQLSNFVGISTALSTTDDDEGRSFIARIVPDLVRSNVKEILWTARLTEQGIEDRYEVVLAEKVAEEMSVAAQPVDRNADDLVALIPSTAQSVTRYGLASPAIAWSALVRNLSDSTDVLNGTVLVRAADGILAPYGIVSATTLVAGVSGPIFTMSLDDSGDQVAALFKVRDLEAVRSVIAVDFSKPSVPLEGFETWVSEDGDFAYAQKGEITLVGEADAVKSAITIGRSGDALSKTRFFSDFLSARGSSVTIGKDAEALDRIAKALSLKTRGTVGGVDYLVSTEFDRRGMTRITVSPFGLIGSLISQFSAG